MTTRISLVAAAVVTSLLTACNDERPVVSLEQAKQITARFEGQGIAPPPRSIADITAILDQQKPDPAKAEANRKAADAQPSANLTGADLANFYFGRGLAAAALGRVDQRVADIRKAVEIGRQSRINVSRMLQDLLAAELQVGNGVAAAGAAREWRSNIQTGYGEELGAVCSSAVIAVRLGDLESANLALQQGQKLLDEAPVRARLHWTYFKELWTSQVAYTRAAVAEARGQVATAVALNRQALAGYEYALAHYEDLNNHAGSPSPRSSWENLVDNARHALARTLAADGQLLAAESEARRLLLNLLERRGRYAPETAAAVIALARIIEDEGRAPEAERLAAAAIDIYENVGAGAGSWPLAESRNVMAEAQLGQGRWEDALATFSKLERALGDDAAGRDRFLQSNPDLAIAYLSAHRAEDARAILQRVVDKRVRSLGDRNAATAEARGLLAAALFGTGRRDAALPEFKAAVPTLLASSRDVGNDEESNARRERRKQVILEAYIGALADAPKGASGQGDAAEAFRIADAIRSRSVQRALAASSARAAASDPALAELVRREQDAQKQVTSLQGVLTVALAAPSDQQDQKALGALRTQIDQLRSARAAIRQDIEAKFPEYVNLIDPRPATVEQARQALRSGEALIATYVGQDRSFVWAVPQAGDISFAQVATGRRELAQAVGRLRRALDPNAATLGDIPAFDVTLAHKLYADLLQPVEAGWKNAKSLLVVQHGTLGQLPFAVLVTAPTQLQPDREGQALFASYRSVPFLARQVSITQLPSVTSLASLRTLPVPKDDRRPFVGFADPWFTPQQAAEAQRETAVARLQTRGAATLVAMRGAPLVRRSAPATESVNSADLSMLPRLPDTADEVRAIAVALNADPVRDVFTGREANERRVRTMTLSDRKVVMFATHGLIPGDLNGLTQPALALSAPSVADIDGDGLLTVDEVLALKLNADWVVLSACNTASGEGAGAEAISGLGRAFFYAGTRALLVTNWPVETGSARALTTDLFRRQAQSPALSRAEALRQAEIAMIDGPGAVDPQLKSTLFSYAHPIFWAPFSLIGDGGGQPGS